MRWRRRRSVELEPVVVQPPAFDPASFFAGMAVATHERVAELELELERQAARVAELEHQAAELEPLAAAELERQAAELEQAERRRAQNRQAQQRRRDRQRRSADNQPTSADRPRPSRDTAGPVTPGHGTSASGDVVQAPPVLVEVPKEPSASAGVAVQHGREPATIGALALELPPPPPASADRQQASADGAPRAGAHVGAPELLKNTPLSSVQNVVPEPVGLSARAAMMLADFDRKSEQLETAGDALAAARRVLEQLADHPQTNTGTATALLGFVRDGRPAAAFHDALFALGLRRRWNPPAFVCRCVANYGRPQPEPSPAIDHPTEPAPPPAARLEPQPAPVEDGAAGTVPPPPELLEQLRRGTRSAALT